ncbi:UPF0175 family protein [Cylindrospermopsis raciborskii]|uniref:UPF0175 family protein n=1 Tax=Cylindrospermopsis raciborskii TaxID=77022 RepID=UPI000778967F|nr:UPF0175 family protein [Cylindrospermopsis raciborskii]
MVSDLARRMAIANPKLENPFEREVKWAMAIKLFEMKWLSSGMAASLLGVNRTTFLMKLADYNIPLIDLTEEELLSDLANA